MTIDEAVKVLNERRHRGSGNWESWEVEPDRLIVGHRVALSGLTYSEFEAVAIAKEYLRKGEPTLAAEVAAVLVQLDELAASWGDEGVFRTCRDRLRAAVEKAKGE